MGSLRSTFREANIERPGPADAALEEAIFRGDYRQVYKYLMAGANPNTRGVIEPNGSPFTWAVAVGQTDIVSILISFGAGKIEPYGTPLMKAGIKEQDLPIVSTLLDHGADIDAGKKDGWTALMAAISWRNFPKAKLLIQRGADVTVRTKEGQTALDLLGSPRGAAKRELKKLLEDEMARQEDNNNTGQDT